MISFTIILQIKAEKKKREKKRTPITDTGRRGLFPEAEEVFTYSKVTAHDLDFVGGKMGQSVNRI